MRAPQANRKSPAQKWGHSSFPEQCASFNCAPDATSISTNGVACNSVTRATAAGDDPAQQNQVTRADGYYRFDMNFTDPACPSGGNYLIDVSPPPTGYIGTYSQIIPPSSGSSPAAFSVPACPGGVDDALAATPDQIFAASLHRVIGLDLADAALEPGTIEIHAQWRQAQQVDSRR